MLMKQKNNIYYYLKIKEMATHIERRQAISTLLDAGKTPTEIIKELKCSRHVVYSQKLKKSRKRLKPN